MLAIWCSPANVQVTPASMAAYERFMRVRTLCGGIAVFGAAVAAGRLSVPIATVAAGTVTPKLVLLNELQYPLRYIHYA